MEVILNSVVSFHELTEHVVLADSHEGNLENGALELLSDPLWTLGSASDGPES